MREMHRKASEVRIGSHYDVSLLSFFPRTRPTHDNLCFLFLVPFFVFLCLPSWEQLHAASAALRTILSRGQQIVRDSGVTEVSLQFEDDVREALGLQVREGQRFHRTDKKR